MFILYLVHPEESNVIKEVPLGTLHTLYPLLLMSTNNVQVLGALWKEGKSQRRHKNRDSIETQQVVP